MKKIIFKILMVALLIAVIVLIGERQYLSMKKKEYRQQLENTLNNQYLEGEDAIGAYYYHHDSVTVWNTSYLVNRDYSLPLRRYLGIKSTEFFWGGQNFDYTNTIKDMLKSGDYEWYDFSDCATIYRPFMIIVKKTNRGYDVIGEYILGIALAYSYPSYLITKESLNSYRGMLYDMFYDMPSDYIYLIKTDMIDSYIKNLFEDKYNGITIRNEITKKNNGINIIKGNIKMDMLDDLVRVNSSMYFGVNEYFELKLDDHFTEIGSSPIVWQTGSYGNYTQTVFTSTVTMHYSIQENKGVLGVLEEELKKKTVICLLILEFFYLLLTIIIVIRKRKYNPSTL